MGDIGLAFPTCVSVNNAVAHFSPLASDPSSSQTLANGDVVKLHVGAHIDGFAAISAETVVVGASEQEPVTGKRADVLKAAWTAAEVAMRLVKVGNKNWAVTEAVNKVAAAFECKPVEGRFILHYYTTIDSIYTASRHAFVPANAERHRWQEAHHFEPGMLREYSFLYRH